MDILTEKSFDQAATDGSVFSSQIYWLQPINSTYSAEFGLRECATVCHVNEETCDGFIFNHPGDCYLTQQKANTSLFTLSGSFDWYTKKGTKGYKTSFPNFVLF